ncbi:MAG TPA: AAA family ATPase [Methylophilaceae bacterium]|nr:AAA family ATPase [Methylophilaceae bacterium]
MYYAHFGLKEAPFKITPNTEFFFSGGNRGAVLDALLYAITSGEGIVKVVGEVGSGKTMLCRMLETLLPKNVESVYLANPSVAPEDILHAIAFELHLALPEKADKLQVMHALQDYLVERHAQNQRVVIFVEEAQGMPLATLEEIRLLSNLETRHDKLLQIVLFGQPELDVNLNDPGIRQLRERITHSFNLGPLEREDIGEYLIYRLRTAGYFGPPLFTKDAISRIAAASKGLVRRVNILADKAMLAAFADNSYAISPKHAAVAIRDSEFNVGQGKTVTSYWRQAALITTLLFGLGAGFGLHSMMRQMRASQPAKADRSQSLDSSTASAQPAEVIASMPTYVPTAVSQGDNDILANRLKATEAWLLQQPGTTVTIQLMGSNSADQLRQQLKDISAMVELDNLFVYETGRYGKPFFTVLYGSFENRDAASRALQGLPKALRTYQPQLRTAGGLLKEIKQLQ